MLDPDYYLRLSVALNDSKIFKEESWHTIELHTDDEDKFLFHLKYYIDHRQHPEQLDIVLSDDYKRFKIYEFFQGIVNSYKFKPSPYPHTEAELKQRYKDRNNPKPPAPGAAKVPVPTPLPTLF